MWYRVRKSWADEKSQLGAYQQLENAVRKANENPGYYVYDESGNVAYAPVAPVSTTVVGTMAYIAKLKKKIGSHKENEVVKVLRDRKKRWVMEDGTVIADKKDLDLTKQIYDPKCVYSKEVAEAWVNQEGFSSKTEWLFWCNKYGQHIYIFKGKKGSWVLQKTYKAGTGTIVDGDGGDPGIGFSYKIYDKQKEFKGVRGMQYWNMHYSSPYGNCIHRGTTGKPSTHGCIAMGNAAVQWVYYNLPLNTKVILY